ncbi:hypothetical protein [Kitasatospora indigofera]|uniref:hypothetical protein n=1 Tax=Kitasatospora indigofera TaxID=67307 RepID=UPI0036915CD0
MPDVDAALLPPAPGYAPTVGLDTTWWVPGSGRKVAPAPDPGPVEPAAPTTAAPGFDVSAFADRLGQLITETPEERRARLAAEREAAFKASGETAEQRQARHKAEAKAAKRAAARKARAKGDSGRARRFRRWCTLTALSASAGYATGLVQLIAPGGPYVGLFLATFGYGLDLRLRGWGSTRVSEVRRPLPLAVLVVVRIPVASGLTVALGVQGLITGASSAFH